MTAGTGVAVGSGATPSVGLSHGDYVDLSSTQTVAGTKSFSSGVTLTAIATPAPTTQVAIYNDSAAMNGMEFNVPTSSTNGYRFMVDGTAEASISAAGAIASTTSSFTESSVSAPAITVGTPRSSANGTWALKVFSADSSTNYGSISSDPLATVDGVSGTDFLLDFNGLNTAAVDEYGDIGLAGSVYAAGGLYSTVAASTADALRWNNYASSTTGLFATSGTVAGVVGNAMAIAQNGGVNLLFLDNSGDVGIAGGYFSASSRAEKRDIRQLPFDPLQLIDDTTWIGWCYKKNVKCNGDVAGDQTYGYIAEDTSAYLAGPKHNHTNAQDIAAIDAAAIKELDARVRILYTLMEALGVWCLGLTIVVLRRA